MFNFWWQADETTTRWVRRLRDHPSEALFIFGFLCTLLIMPRSPMLMVSDNFKRFRNASWICTGADPGGPLPGVGGVGHHWYGIGQSLVFIPFDRCLAALGINDVGTRFSITVLVLAPVINGLVLFLSWHTLRMLDFKPRVCTWGTLLLMTCTTLPWHFQNNQENPMMLASALAAVIGLFRWFDTGSWIWLNIACAAQAFSLCIRVPNLAYILPIFGLPLLSRILDRTVRVDWKEELGRLWGMMLVAVPWMGLGLLLDRLWQWVRFGTWKGTYFTVFAEWAFTNFDILPPGFPFSVNFNEGLRGQLFSPGKGVVFYEPFVLLAVAFWFLPRTKTNPRLKAMILVATVALIGSIAGLARSNYWDGDPSWGPRLLASPAHLLELPLAAWLVASVTGSIPLRRLLGVAAASLMTLQISGVWWPAYHEVVIAVQKRGAKYAEFTTSLYQRGLPWSDSSQTQEWRIANRPLQVAIDLGNQFTQPRDVWLAQTPTARMIWGTLPLTNVSPFVRWTIRLIWFSGIAVLVWLTRQAIVGSREQPTQGRQADESSPTLRH